MFEGVLAQRALDWNIAVDVTLPAVAGPCGVIACKMTSQRGIHVTHLCVYVLSKAWSEPQALRSQTLSPESAQRCLVSAKCAQKRKDSGLASSH